MDKKEAHTYSLNQIKALVEAEKNTVAKFANVAAVLKENQQYWWIGFYFVGGDELILGPFQGPVACTRIGYNKGVCGTSWAEKKMINVPDVHEFPGHIACSAISKSELVVPILKNGEIIAILDADSELENNFDESDERFFSEIAKILSESHVSA